MMEVILNCPPCQVQPQKNGLVQFITYLAGRFAIVQEKKCGINFLSDFENDSVSFPLSHIFPLCEK